MIRNAQKKRFRKECSGVCMCVGVLKVRKIQACVSGITRPIELL